MQSGSGQEQGLCPDVRKDRPAQRPDVDTRRWDSFRPLEALRRLWYKNNATILISCIADLAVLSTHLTPNGVCAVTDLYKYARQRGREENGAPRPSSCFRKARQIGPSQPRYRSKWLGKRSKSSARVFAKDQGSNALRRAIKRGGNPSLTRHHAAHCTEVCAVRHSRRAGGPGVTLPPLPPLSAARRWDEECKGNEATISPNAPLSGTWRFAFQLDFLS